MSIFVCGCTNYKVPIQTKDHPASTCVEVVQVSLSKVLDIDENHVGDEGCNALSQ